MGRDSRELIESLLRNDDAPGVRRAALRKLPDPALLAEVAGGDADESVREEAQTQLAKWAVGSEDETAALSALAALTESRHLATLAREAHLEGLRREALGRLTDARSLVALARGAPHAETRLLALERLEEPGALAEVALKSEHKDVALAALERIQDDGTLRLVASRARNKAAARKARSLLPEPEDESGPAVASEEPPPPAPIPEPAPPDVEAALEARRTLADRASALEADAAPETVAALRGEWDALPPADGRDAVQLEARFNEAITAGLQHHRERTLREARRPELAALCDRLEAAAEAPKGSEEHGSWNALAREWAAALAAGPVDDDLAERHAAAAARRAARDQEDLEARRQREEEGLGRLRDLAERLDTLAKAEPLSLRDAEHGLREARLALSDPGPLPKAERTALLDRIKAGRAALFPRAQELREADEWTRWANVAIQEELCARTEALLGVEDVEAVARELRTIDGRWKEARHVPKEEGDALWARFRAAREPLRERCGAYFAARAAERAENKARKLALCERAEALADSSDWLKTAHEIQALQAEWKAVGPVPRKDSDALWKRFRKACDTFFSRRKEDLHKRKEVWGQNLERKEALCAQAEALASSTDWDAGVAEIKRLQAEWKAIGPVRRNRSEVVWKRFRTACDAFFDRYRNRDAAARDAAREARQALAAEVEALADAAEAPEDLPARVQDAIVRFKQAPGGLPREETVALQRRFADARDRVVAVFPDRFRGTELDPEASRARMEKLCARVEALAPSSPEAEDAQSLAARLREALATNTMGGAGAAEGRWKAALAEVEAARAAWARLGPVPGEAGRALQERFEAACRRVDSLRPTRR